MWLSTTRLVLAISLIGDALAFNFVLQTGANGGISKCGTVNVVWQGGSPPFHMVVIVSYNPTLHQMYVEQKLIGHCSLLLIILRTYRYRLQLGPALLDGVITHGLLIVSPLEDSDRAGTWQYTTPNGYRLIFQIRRIQD